MSNMNEVPLITWLLMSMSLNVKRISIIVITISVIINIIFIIVIVIFLLLLSSLLFHVVIVSLDFNRLRDLNIYNA